MLILSDQSFFVDILGHGFTHIISVLFSCVILLDSPINDITQSFVHPHRNFIGWPDKEIDEVSIVSFDCYLL